MALSLFRRRNETEREEMSFIDHLEALRGHLFRSVIAIIIGAVVVGIYNDFFIERVLLGPTHSDFPTYGVMCDLGQRLHLGKTLCMNIITIKMQSTSVGAQFSMWFTVVIIGGIIIAFPYIFYEFWSFVKPALTKKELNIKPGA
jgi:sec-independent protein translocase protein TatC